jgi:hypothetical protein
MIEQALEVTVDGISYPLAALSEEARAQVASLQFVEAEIARLQAQLAVYQTARAAYSNALGDLLPRSVQ